MKEFEHKRLRLVSAKIKNIEGLSANLKFTSNLIVIYGYNRSGKTIIIKALRYAFKGFKARKINLTHVLGANANGHIILVFEFSGRLYRIEREITQSVEFLSFKESKTTIEEIKNLPPAKQKSIWSKGTCNEIIPKSKILVSGPNKNIEEFDEKLHELRLYLEIIDRLIAIENVKEFRNATQNFNSQEGLGYESIKQLLYEDLKEKDDSIKDILKYSETKIKNLETHNLSLLEEFKELMLVIESNFEGMNLEKADLEQMEKTIKILKFDSEYQQHLKDFSSQMTKKQNKRQQEKDDAIHLQNKISIKEEMYQKLGNLKKSTQLKHLESVIKNFQRDKKEIDSLNNKLIQIQRGIEKNPSNQQIERININFDYLFEEKIREILKEYSLDQILNNEEIQKIPTMIDEIIFTFNEAIKLYLRNNELLTKNQITPDQIPSKKIDYSLQLERIKNPISFESKDKIYTIYGRVEEENKNKILKVYMPIRELKNYIVDKNPISVNHNIFPLLTSEKDKIPKDIIEELSQDIILIIKELEELEELQATLKGTYEKLIEDLNKLTKIISTLSKINERVETWHTHITSQKSLASEFIIKYLKIKQRSITDFNVIEKRLNEIENQALKELKSEFNSMNLDYKKSLSLLENLKLLSKFLEGFIKYSTILIDVISKISKTMAENQEKYKKLCENKYLNENLKDIILPLVQIICKQINSNIHLDKMEDEMMNQIIKTAQHFYYNITKENFLIFEKSSENGKIFLKPYIRKMGGVKLPILDTGPSGSEQASIALGIMVALAKSFNAFVVIDEVTNNFDFPTKLEFFKAIQNLSEDLFWIIVIKVESSNENLHEEFQQIQQSFSACDIFQPTKDFRELTTTVKKINNFNDFIIREEI